MRLSDSMRPLVSAMHGYNRRCTVGACTPVLSNSDQYHRIRLSCSYSGYALSPQKTCLPCSYGCEVCTFAPPGQARCIRCFELSLVDGECRRCDDPRCANCSGNEHWCKKCRSNRHVVNKATGRCEDPSWPVPCPVGGRAAVAAAHAQCPSHLPALASKLEGVSDLLVY